jgi:dolichyl-phosphate-mannose--protein O-mannosyl transferase
MSININALGIFLIILGTMSLIVGNPFGWWGLAAIILALAFFGGGEIVRGLLKRKANYEKQRKKRVIHQFLVDIGRSDNG